MALTAFHLDVRLLLLMTAAAAVIAAILQVSYCGSGICQNFLKPTHLTHLVRVQRKVRHYCDRIDDKCGGGGL